MLEGVVYLGIVLLGILNGFILAYLCKDEIAAWRKRFLIMAIISAVLAATLFFSPFEYKIPSIIALLFMTMTGMTIYSKK